MRNTLDDKRSADGFREALNSLIEIEALVGNVLSLEASNARTKFLNHRSPERIKAKNMSDEQNILCQCSNCTTFRKNRDDQLALNEGRWPYSKFSLGYVWWLLTQKGRIAGDE
jgi:hypothetical protein